jgi:hypothetical protein
MTNHRCFAGIARIILGIVNSCNQNKRPGISAGPL